MERAVEDIVRELQEAQRNDDVALVEKLESEWKEKIKTGVQEVTSGLETSREELQSIDGMVGRKYSGERRKIYKELIELYRESKRLAAEASSLKKGMRAEWKDGAK